MSVSSYLAELLEDLWQTFVATRLFLAILAVCVGACLVWPSGEEAGLYDIDVPW